jgi:hypothetical protein
MFLSVFWIQIQMSLVLPNPDSEVWIWIRLRSGFLLLCDFLCTFIFKNDANVPSKIIKQKNFVLFASRSSMTKIARSGSGSNSQRHESADPDPHQNVMDPEHRLLPTYMVDKPQHHK